MIPSDLIERASAVRIEDEIERRRIKLVGRVDRCGPCPLCGGKDCFSINTRKQVFLCRGCVARGNVIALVRFLDGCGLLEALEYLTGERAPAPSRPAPAATDAPSDDDRDARALMFAKQIVSEMRPILGTPGETYLRDIRRIDTEAIADVLERIDAIGWHPAVYFNEPGHALHGRKAAIAKHARLAEAASAQAEQWCAEVRAETKTGQPAPDRPTGADAPEEPPRPRLVAMDATTEELQHLLAEQPRGLLYVRDELSGWFGNHDRYGGNGGDRAFFLEAWDGGSYIVDRVKHRSKPLRISRAALGILGGMQPDRLREALAGADDGLAARFAYIWPEPPPISKLANEPDETMRDRRWRLVEAARRLYGLKMSVDAAGAPAPGLLRLDRNARALFDELRQEAMQRARSSRGLAGGWHGKTPGRALRFALVFELLMWSASDGSEPLVIGGGAMARAGCYLDYLAGMFDRVTAGLAISREEADAEAIARHVISTRPTALNERELYQLPGWAWLRDNERRSHALRLLADAGWIRRLGAAGRGRPRGDWQISPRLWETSP